MVLGVDVGGLVVVGDDWHELAGRLVAGDDVELSGAEVGEQHRLVLPGGDPGDGRLVELLLEDDLVVDPRSCERSGGDRGAGEPVGVDVRGQEHAVGRTEAVGTVARASDEVRHGWIGDCHYPSLARDRG